MAGSGNSALAFGALLGGAIVLDYGVKSIKSVGAAKTGTGTGSGSRSSGSSSVGSGTSGYGAGNVSGNTSIGAITGTAGKSIVDQVNAIQDSGWASSHYRYQLLSDVQAVIDGQAQLNSNQETFAQTLSQITGLNINVVRGWVHAEEPASATGGVNGANNWLNVGSTDSGFYGGSNPAWNNPVTAAEYTAYWMSGGKLGKR